MRILDLFSGTQSVKKAFPDSDYIGIDIYGEDNKILDLSEDNIVEKLKELLPPGWKPDFIWASPICTPFSMGHGINGGTLSYIIDNDKLRLRTKEDFININHRQYNRVKHTKEFQERHIEKGILGIKLLENTIRIINHFKVPFIIENPKTSLMKYIIHNLMNGLIENYCSYCMYGFAIRKNTTLYSNVKINLLSCQHKSNHMVVMNRHPKHIGKEFMVENTKLRGMVPPLLIRESITSVLKESK